MNPRKYAALLIAQKNYFKAVRSGDNGKEHPFYIHYHQFIAEQQISISEILTPPCFANQPQIPVVLLVPPIPHGEKRPMIVSTHGGPHSRCYIDKPLAENILLLSLGYIVAIPNYRGSIDHPSNYPNSNIFKQCLDMNHHALVPLVAEDIYSATLHLSTLVNVDATRIMLRSISYGSYANAYLLTQTQRGKFKQLFCGVHLSSGIQYPNGKEIPVDIPLMVSHSMDDKDASIVQAKKFMLEVMEARVAYEQTYQHKAANLKLFVARHSGHHLLADQLEEGMEQTDAYQEVLRFIETHSDFTRRVCDHLPWQENDIVSQYASLVADNDITVSPSLAASIERIQHERLQIDARYKSFGLVPLRKKREQVSQAVSSWGMVMAEMKQELRRREINVVDAMLDPLPLPMAPSEKHMQVFLGKKYCETDLKENIKQCLDKCERSIGYNLSDTERDFLINAFSELIIAERRLSVDHLVTYHGCNAAISTAYELYSLIYKILYIDANWQALRPDHEFFTLCPDISSFIARFKIVDLPDNLRCKELKDEDIPNNQPHYSNLAVAMNVFLFGNCTENHFSSIDFFLKNRTELTVDLAGLLHHMLDPLNIPRDCLSELLTAFTALGKVARGSLYQVAVPKEQARGLSYASAEFGFLKPLQQSNDTVTVVEELMKPDVVYEKFGKLEQYLLSLQSRNMLPPHINIKKSVVHIPGSDQLQTEAYREILTRTAHKIVAAMLYHFEPFQTLNANTRLVGLFKRLMNDQRLPVGSAARPDQLFIRALSANDFKTVNTILLSAPDFMKTYITISSEYIFRSDDKRIASYQSTPLSLIANHQSYPLAMLYELYDKAVADEFIRLMFDKIPYCSPAYVCQLFARIPAQKRHEFSTCFALVDYPYSEDYRTLLQLLDLPHRAAFVFFHKACTSDFNKVLMIIDLLEDKDQERIIEEYRDTLKHCSYLYQLLNKLTRPLQLATFNKYFKSVTSTAYIGEIMQLCCPDADHNALVAEFNFQIKDELELLHLIDFQADKLAFVKQNVHLFSMEGFFQLALKKLRAEDRYDIAVQVYKLNNKRFFHMKVDKTIKLLPQPLRYPFMCEIHVIWDDLKRFIKSVKSLKCEEATDLLARHAYLFKRSMRREEKDFITEQLSEELIRTIEQLSGQQLLVNHCHPKAPFLC